MDFQSIPEKIVEIGEKLAEYTAMYENLSEMSKVILASIQNDIQSFMTEKSVKITESEKQSKALGNSRYKDHLDGLKVARQEMLKHRAYMQALDAKFELMRSLNSLKKAEMRM